MCWTLRDSIIEGLGCREKEEEEDRASDADKARNTPWISTLICHLRIYITETG
jgi:hypothetical protein